MKKKFAKQEHQEELKKHKFGFMEAIKMKVVETDFMENSKFKLSEDIYSLSIAAYLSKEVSPLL